MGNCYLSLSKAEAGRDLGTHSVFSQRVVNVPLSHAMKAGQCTDPVHNFPQKKQVVSLYPFTRSFKVSSKVSF